MPPNTILPEAPDDLLDLLDTGEFVLFLGAGVGMEAGLPGWKDSLLEIARQLRPVDAGFADLIETESRAGRFLAAAELLYLASIPPHDRFQILQSVFNKSLSITRRLRLLSSTRCQGIVTTNFDRSLLQAAHEAKVDLVQFGESDADLAAARVETRRFLVRLHGRIEVPETLVFAERHYRALQDRQSYVEFFRELFLNRNIIFFGFSFADPIIATLIGNMASAVHSLFRRKAYALVPEPSSELKDTLLKAGITPVPYPREARQSAWELLAAHREGEPPLSIERFTSHQVRSHLAAAYARAKSRQFSADRDRMLSALMMPILATRGTNTVVDVDTFLRTTQSQLALPRHFPRSHLLEALKILENDGLVMIQGDNILVGDLPQPKELAKDSERLVDGLVARSTVRFRQSGLESQRPLLDQFVLTALALDGLHLAHTLIRHQGFDAARLERTVGEAARRISIPYNYKEMAIAALTDLLTSPDPEEEQILANISSVVFGTALLLADPLLVDKLTSPFKQGAYVDTSVLLPWLADGHPLQIGYESVLRSFDASGIRVLPGYINEIVHHKRLALDAFRDGGFDDSNNMKRYASLFGLHNINAFLGGYAGSLEKEGGDESFEEYMDRVAPFEDEAAARQMLTGRGLVVDDHKQRDVGLVGELNAALKERRKFRDEVRVGHDAAQIEVLASIKDRDIRPYFITADRALIGAAADTSCSHVVPHVLLPEQVAFLAQMADRKTEGFQVFSRTLWTVGETVSDKIKRYYTNRVLEEYEEGLVTEIDTILDALLKQMQEEGIRLEEEDGRDRRTDQAQVELFKTLDRFEARFFQNMADAMERVRRRQGE